MSGKVLISASELSDMMRIEPVVLIDTRDPNCLCRSTYPRCGQFTRSLHIPGDINAGGRKGPQENLCRSVWQSRSWRR